MAELSPIEKLDNVLTVLRIKDHADISMIRNDIKFVPTDNEFDRIINKLGKDGYINIVGTIPLYTITFEGYVFEQQGGYENEIRKSIISNRGERTRTLILVIGTALAGAYGLFEILKWFVPYFQNNICYCVFFWQKCP
jgi:hypothetical protein